VFFSFFGGGGFVLVFCVFDPTFLVSGFFRAVSVRNPLSGYVVCDLDLPPSPRFSEKASVPVHRTGVSPCHLSCYFLILSSTLSCGLLFFNPLSMDGSAFPVSRRPNAALLRLHSCKSIFVRLRLNCGSSVAGSLGVLFFFFQVLIFLFL